MIKCDDFRKEYLLKEIEFKKQILNNYGNYEKGINEGIKKIFLYLSKGYIILNYVINIIENNNDIKNSKAYKNNLKKIFKHLNKIIEIFAIINKL